MIYASMICIDDLHRGAGGVEAERRAWGSRWHTSSIMPIAPTSLRARLPASPRLSLEALGKPATGLRT